MRDLTLPAHPGLKLTETKLKSLSRKYFSIPKKYLDYYPEYKGIVKSIDDPPAKLNRKRKRDSDNPNKKLRRKVGRPKKLPVILTGVKSITKYFRPV